jgi:hypothetical protein
MASHPGRQYSSLSGRDFPNIFEEHAASIFRIFLFSTLKTEAVDFPEIFYLLSLKKLKA